MSAMKTGRRPIRREVLAEGCLKDVVLKSRDFGVSKLIVSFNSCGQRSVGISFVKNTKCRLVLEILENPDRAHHKL